MKTNTMTLTRKRQTVFPHEWCKRAGLENGGVLNVFELDDHTLVITVPRPPNREELEKLLDAVPPRKGDGLKIVSRILREVRSEDRDASRH